MSYTSIIGTGSYIPENIIDNNYISQFVDTSDEWITERTGIKARRLSKGEDTSQLAIKAAQRAIEMANQSRGYRTCNTWNYYTRHFYSISSLHSPISYRCS